MYEVYKKYGNLNRKIYINSIFEQLLTSNFAESLFLKFSNGYKILRDSLDVYFSHIFSKISQKSVVSWTTYFINLKLSSASRLFCSESTEIQFSILTRKPKAWNIKIALQGGSEGNKKKWDELFSRARATRKKRGQRAPPPFLTRFSRTAGASVVVTALVSDLCTLVTTSCEGQQTFHLQYERFHYIVSVRISVDKNNCTWCNALCIWRSDVNT